MIGIIYVGIRDDGIEHPTAREVGSRIVGLDELHHGRIKPVRRNYVSGKRVPNELTGIGGIRPRRGRVKYWIRQG